MSLISGDILQGLLFLILTLITASSETALIAAIVLHEASHVITAWIMRLGKPRIKLSPVGIRIEYPVMISPVKGIILCLSGPFFGIVFGVLSRCFCISEYFFLYSVGLGVMNLLPLPQLDGGCALNHLSELFDNPYPLLRATRYLSVTLTIVIFIISTAVQLLVGVNLSLMAVSVYLTVSVLSQNA